jgi:hypothetical protein
MCDRCGEKIMMWNTVEVSFDAAPGMGYVDCKHVLEYKGNYEFCSKCMAEIDRVLKMKPAASVRPFGQ